MSKRIVIVGGGLSAKHSAEVLLKKAKDLDITIIQPNQFVEWPLAMTVCLVQPELHDKALATDASKFQVKGVNYKYGVAESVDTAAKVVQLRDNAGAVPYDALIIATGFKMPLIYPGVGVTLQERKAEVRKVGDAIKGATSCVVAGGGLVGLELAGDIRIQYPDKKISLLCRGGVLGQWPQAHRSKVEAQLQRMNIEVVTGASDAPTESSLDAGKIMFGDKELAYDVFIPAYSQGPNTSFLTSAAPAVLDGNGSIDVNEFLQAKACPEIFAVGVSNIKEWVGMPKLEGQWTSATKNVIGLLNGKPLTAHKENLPFMKLPVATNIGHGPKGYAWLDFNQMPPPLKCCCCCGYGGFPCCPPCWPCCMCAGLGCCPCGVCCGPPEGKGTSTFFGKMAFMSSGFHFKGMGEAPKQQSMQ